MGAGYRNTFAGFSDGLLGYVGGDSGDDLVQNTTRRRKRKRSSKRVKRTHYRRTKRHTKKSSRRTRTGKSKRPYPTWLKKYWYKKKKS